MSFQIAIPSYKRSGTIVNQTIKTFEGLDAKITVFVVREEYDAYRYILPEKIDVIVGKLGIVAQRKFIHHYYPEGTHLLCLDDDITEFDTLGEDYTLFIENAFKDCIEYGSFLWSVYPVFNPFFRKNRPQLNTGLVFIIGTLYGVIIRHDRDLETTTVIGEKEDTERTLRYYIKDGSVLRYDKVGFKTKFFSKDGGMGGLRSRLEAGNIDTDLLVRDFGIYGKKWIRKNGVAEFKIETLGRRLPTDEVKYLQSLEASEFNNLYEMLSKIKIHIVTSRANGGTGRRGFDNHRSTCLGIVKQRATGKICQSSFSRKHPLIHDEIYRICKLFCPFQFDSVQLNHNTFCPAHFDSKNAGQSCIVSFGDYEGCKLVVNNTEHDAYLQPLMFNGSVLNHYNTPLVSGNKYSLVYYNNTTFKKDTP